MLEERWAAMQSMEAMIRERGEAIAGQGRMLEERWVAIKSMKEAGRDLASITPEERYVSEKCHTVKQAARILFSAVHASLHHRLYRTFGRRQ
jgi:hypothetical protein